MIPTAKEMQDLVKQGQPERDATNHRYAEEIKTHLAKRIKKAAEEGDDFIVTLPSYPDEVFAALRAAGFKIYPNRLGHIVISWEGV